jgi:hypothetical protein
MYNPLNKHPKVREGFLLGQWITTGATAVATPVLIGVYGLDDIPGWFNITVAALAALWTYTGLTAQGNVTGTDAEGYKITTGADGS